MEQDEQENDSISIPEFTFVMNWFVQYFFFFLLLKQVEHTKPGRGQGNYQDPR